MIREAAANARKMKGYYVNNECTPAANQNTRSQGEGFM